MISAVSASDVSDMSNDLNYIEDNGDSSLSADADFDDSVSTDDGDSSSDLLSNDADKSSTSLNVVNDSVYNGNYFAVNLSDESGNPLSGKTVHFNITKSGKVYNRVTGDDGLVLLKINNSLSTMDFVISFDGDDDYLESSCNCTLQINKSPTAITYSSDSISCGDTLEITLTDSVSNTPLSDKTVYFTILSSNKTYSRTTDSNGNARLTVNLIGNVSFLLHFDGDIWYAPSNCTCPLSISQSSSTIAVINSTVYRGSCLCVRLTNEKTGAAVSGKKISFIIPNSNKTYYRTTDPNGYANLTINGNKNFTFDISFAGDKYYLSSSNNTTIELLIPGSKIVGNNGSVCISTPFVVTLKNNITGAAVSGKKITFTLTDSNKTYTRTTNSSGKAALTINIVNPFNLTVSFEGDEYYLSSSSDFTLVPIKSGVVFQAASTSLVYGDNLVVTLKNNVTKSVLSSKKVVFTLVDSNVSYNRTTNSSGKAALSIHKMGSYDIMVSFAGDKTYEEGNQTFTLNVSKGKTSLSVSSSLTIYERNNFTVVLKDAKGNAISGKTIHFKLNSTNYTATTNSKGQATIVVVVDGTYSVTISFDGDSNYYSSKLTKTLVVKENATAKEIYAKIDSSQYAQILNCKEAFDADEFAKYLKTGGYSALNSAINQKAAELTKGLTTTVQKANAIYNYVRDNIAYSYYANSKKGASGTLSSGSGNCVDQASLVVALARSAGLYARYSHAKGCTFSSGLVTGHVWAQIYDDKTQTWYTADATSKRNNLGDINNWNTKSYSKPTNYVLVPF